MYDVDEIVSLVDYTLDTRKKRHIVGGVLISVSLLFGCLAFTVITIQNEEDKNEQNIN